MLFHCAKLFLAMDSQINNVPDSFADIIGKENIVGIQTAIAKHVEELLLNHKE